MERKLLYSWDEDDTRAAIDQYNIVLPNWMRLPVYALSFCGLFYIFSSYIFPMGHTWLLMLIGAPSLLVIVIGLIVAATKPKTAAQHSNCKYLKIYKDEIAIDLEHITGSYKINNIDIESLAVKYIAHWGHGGVGPVKGLSFKMKKPATEIKVPLFMLLPRHTKELKQAITMLKKHEAVVV